ncbi:MAG: hypothetical protein O7G85_11965 [Planctomycetota bacterium]|nr:hypothetical protein [Planctomycetota bacterium]
MFTYTYLRLSVLPMLVIAWTLDTRLMAQQGLEMAQRLIDSSGEAYVELRNQAIDLSEDEFVRMTQQLRGHGDISKGAFIALLLECRRAHLDAAAQFDMKIQESIRNPIATHMDGLFRYKLPYSVDDRVVEPLIFEYIAFLDLPSGMKRKLNERRIQPNPSLVNAILYLTHEDMLWQWNRFLLEASDGQPDTYGRIINYLTERYIAVRQTKESYSPAVYVLTMLDTEEAYTAVQSIIACETALLTKEGKAPWNDRTAESEYEESKTRTLSIMKQLSTAREQKNQVNIGELDIRVMVQQRRHEALLQRLNTRLYWEKINRMKNTMRARLDAAKLK